ncbi:RNase L inhibitor, partial [mine drainage metagenome]
MPTPTGVTGLLGANGIGKSTALRLVAGRDVPNLGHYDRAASWDAVLERYRGTAFHAHFEQIARGTLRTA